MKKEKGIFRKTKKDLANASHVFNLAIKNSVKMVLRYILRLKFVQSDIKRKINGERKEANCKSIASFDCLGYCA